jgi:hypothetical protein
MQVTTGCPEDGTKNLLGSNDPPFLPLAGGGSARDQARNARFIAMTRQAGTVDDLVPPVGFN